MLQQDEAGSCDSESGRSRAKGLRTRWACSEATEKLLLLGHREQGALTPHHSVGKSLSGAVKMGGFPWLSEAHWVRLSMGNRGSPEQEGL